MICRRCGADMVRLKDDIKQKKICNDLGISYCGNYICKKCYGVRRGEKK